MPFNNNVQIGTDTSLSGYAGNGATVVSHVGRAMYQTTATLTVQGDLTIPVLTEFLSGSTQMIVVEDGGSLTLDAITSPSDADTTTYADYAGVQTSHKNNTSSGTYNPVDAIIHVKSGGMFIWNGGALRGECPIVFDNGSIIRINDGVWDAMDFFNTYPAMIRCFTANYDISGLTLVRGGAFVPMQATTHSAPEIKYENAYGIGMSGGITSSVIPYGYLDATNPKGMLGYWANKLIWAQAGSSQANPILTGYSANPTTNNRGIIYCSVPITLNGGAGSRFFIPNHDVRGLRAAFPYGYGLDNFTDLDGLLIENNTQTNLPLFVGHRTTGNEQGTNDSGVNRKDYYCKDPDNEPGKRDIYGFLYGKQPLVISDYQTFGSSSIDLTIEFKDDNSITETLKATVDAYTTINDLEQLYDRIAAEKVDDPTLGGLDNPLITATGTTLTILAGWSLVRDQSITSAVEFDTTNSQIKVKAGANGAGANGMSRTDKFDTIVGIVDSSFEGHTTAQFVKSNGKVDVTFKVTENSNIQSTAIGVWPVSDGLNTRTNIRTSAVENGTAVITDLSPNTNYYWVTDGVGAMRTLVDFNTGEYGASPSTITLDQIVDVAGVSILPATLTTEQRRIADMFTYNIATGHTDINLPDDYASDTRWDANNKIWTFTSDDFTAIAYRVEEIQSSIAGLVLPSTIRVEPFKLTLQSDATFKMSQHMDNADGVIINMNVFTITREGDDTQLKTYLDHTNGVIHTNAGNPVVATISTPVSVLEAVTDQIPVKVNESTDISEIRTLTGRLTATRMGLLDDLAAMITNHQYTGDALANAPVGSSGGGETVSVDAQAIANAVWSAAVRTLTDSDGKELINTEPDLRTVIEENALTVEQIVTGIMDAPYGERPDGTPYLFNTLGEHLWHFYPPEIIRQLLETTLNGITAATRAQPQPGAYGSGTLGDAIREVLTRASEKTAIEARDHALAANVQTQDN